MLGFVNAPRAALALLLLFHLLANCWWLHVDNHPVRTDEETHMLFARDYFEALFPREGGGILRRLDAVARIEPGNPAHPPLLHILGAVVIRAFGYSINKLAFTTTLLFLLTLLGCYLLARLYLYEWEAFYCALVISFTPLIFTASRYFMTDFLSMTLVVWALYALVKTEYLTRTRWAIFFGLINGLAMLARVNTPVYYVLPTMLVGVVSLACCIREGNGRIRRLFLVVLNTALVASVAIIICGPWYIWHGERFLTYWFVEHNAGAGGPLSVVQVAQEPLAPATTAPSESAAMREIPKRKDNVTKPKPAPQTARTAAQLRFIPRRVVPWMRYPVFVVNHGVFLISFLLALTGAALFGFSRRFRCTSITWLLLASVVGSYLLLTCLMSFATSRYTLQALPALMMFAPLPLFMISHRSLRRLGQGALLALLLFQYGNLTFRDYGPLKELTLPLYPDARMQNEYDDDGLYLYRSRLTLGFSYAGLGAPTKYNFKDRLFEAMAKSERRNALWGETAYYTRLNARGMMLEEQHYWPIHNNSTPFAYPGMAERHRLTRRLHHYGWGATVEDIQPFLAVAHFVVYSTEGIDDDEEERWLRVLAGHGFSLVEHFSEPRMSRIPQRAFGVLARSPDENLVAALSSNQWETFDFFDLYRYCQTAAFGQNDAATQSNAQNKMNALTTAKGEFTPLNPHISFDGASVIHDRDDWYVFRLTFKTQKLIERDWRIYFHGYPLSDPETTTFDPSTRVEWNFNPAPATRFWRDGDYVVVLHRVKAAPFQYALNLGFYTNYDGYLGSAMDLGVVNFGTIPRRDDISTPIWLDGFWNERYVMAMTDVSATPRLVLPPELQAVKRFTSPAMRALARQILSWMR